MILSPTKQKKCNKAIYGFDIETYDRNRKFLCASIYGDGYNEIFYDKRSLIDKFKERRFHNSIIAAHNLAFDFFGTFFGEREEKSFVPFFRNSDLLFCKAYSYDDDFHIKRKDKDSRTVYFVDVMNYGKISVENSGRILNLPKLKKPETLGEYPKDKKAWDELIGYNLRDSEISQKFFRYLKATFHDLGASFKLTIASTAMSLFTNRYLKDTYYRHTEPDLLEQFNGYYGGRCECFGRGKIEDYEYYDFNSLYPSVMRDKPYPNPNTIRKNRKNTDFYIRNYDGFADAIIISPDDMMIPILPYRTDTKLLFPVGKFRGMYPNVELRKALEHGYKIISVFRNIYFTDNCEPFREFVDDLYSLRRKFKSEDNNMEYAVKIIMNSLYGKFGEKFIDKDNIILIPDDYLDVLKYDYFEPLTENYARVKFDKVEPKRYCIPAWAAYVTAYGRLKLWETLNYCEPLYCDTDSIITKKKIRNSDRLGELKHEAHITQGMIVKPKFYMIDEKVKVKGVGRKLVLKDFSMLLENNKVQYTKFTKFRESLRRHLCMNELQGVIKELTIEDDKRRWNKKFTGELEFSEPILIDEKQEDLYILPAIPAY